MSDIPDNAAEHCPGTQSNDAGKSSACAGCPNQNLCASGETKGPDPAIELVKERLAEVNNKLLILSGKGGVGKSTVTSLVARAIALRYPDKNFAVLDIDICGPSQPRMFGVLNEQIHQSGSGWSPVYIDDNLSLMSIGFLLGSQDDAVIWRGPKKTGMIRQFLSEVDWGKLDCLIIDTPPGTSDEHLAAVNYLTHTSNWGAVVVTTPQEISLLDVRKEINFCKKVNIPVVGVVENMKGFVCPKCQTNSDIFPATSGGAAQMCQDMHVPLIGELPIDPQITRACDQGINFIEENSEAMATKALNQIVDRIAAFYGING